MKTSFKNSFVHCIDKLDIMKKVMLLFLGLILISCGGGDDEDVTPVQVTPEPVVVQKFTLTV